MSRRWPALVLVAAAAVVAWWFAHGVLVWVRPFALPSDDAYAQLGAGRALLHGVAPAGWPAWPAVTALLSLLASGPVLAATAFGVGALLHAAALVGIFATVRRLGDWLGGLLAGLVGAGLLAYTAVALSGTGVALSSALAIACLRVASPPSFREPSPPRAPSILAVLVLALASLAGPASFAAAACIALGAAVSSRHAPRAALSWLAPLVPGLGWLALRPSALPLVASSLAVPVLLCFAYLAASIVFLFDARRVRRLPFALSVVAAPLAAYVFSPAVALPLALVPIGYGLSRIRVRVRAAAAVSVLAAIVLLCAAIASGATAATAFGEAAKLEGTQGVALAAIVAAKFPSARVWSAYPGALAAACDCAFATPADADGPGARFELAEHLPPASRPTLVAGPAGWLPADLTGELLRRIPGPPRGAPLDLAPLRFDRLGTGERPVTPHDGWALVDRVDVADLASERAHRWQRDAASPPGSLVARDLGATGLVLDGGRAIHASERFALALDPAKPSRLLLRTGGTRSDTVTRGARVQIYDDATGAVIETLTVPAPGPLVELSVALPAGVVAIRTAADAPYHAYQWFALQPE